MQNIEELLNIIFADLSKGLTKKQLKALKETEDYLRGHSPLFMVAWYIQYKYILPDSEIRQTLAAHYKQKDLDRLSKAILLDYRNRLS